MLNTKYWRYCATLKTFLPIMKLNAVTMWHARFNNESLYIPVTSLFLFVDTSLSIMIVVWHTKQTHSIQKWTNTIYTSHAQLLYYYLVDLTNCYKQRLGFQYVYCKIFYNNFHWNYIFFVMTTSRLNAKC